jgi:hypothetical protein
VSFDDRLTAFLEHLPALKGVTDDRVYPLALPQQPIMPAITYQPLSSTNPYRSQTDDGPDVDRYRLSCWGRNLEEANIVAQAIKLAIDQGDGPAGSNVRDGGAADQDPATQLVRRRLEVLFTFED